MGLRAVSPAAIYDLLLDGEDDGAGVVTPQQETFDETDPDESNSWVITNVEDPYPPVMDQRVPSPGATGVPLDNHVGVRVYDAGLGLDLDATELTLDGTVIWENGGPASGWTGTCTLTSHGYVYDLAHPTDFTKYHTYLVHAYAKDVVGNEVTIDWSFRSMDPDLPIFTNLSPPSGTSAAVTSHITFDVLDPLSGVDTGTTEITVLGSVVWSSGAPVPTWAGSCTPTVDGYHYDLYPLFGFPIWSHIPIHVWAEDFEGNAGSVDWSFESEGRGKPEVVARRPDDGERIAAIDPVTFTIRDDQGVVGSSILLYVDSVQVYSSTDGFAAGWGQSTIMANASPGILGYAVKLVRATTWPQGEHTVTVVAEDIYTERCNVSWTFGVQRPFTFRVWSFIFDGIKKADGEE